MSKDSQYHLLDDSGFEDGYECAVNILDDIAYLIENINEELND